MEWIAFSSQLMRTIKFEWVNEKSELAHEMRSTAGVHMKLFSLKHRWEAIIELELAIADAVSPYSANLFGVNRP